MADQDLVAIHYFPFLVKKFPPIPKQLAIFTQKLVLWYILTIFPSNTWFFGII